MKTFLVAPDSFKGSLSAGDAAMIMTRAIRSVIPDARVVQIPIADGGEGTVETLVTASLGYFLEADATNAWGERDVVPWGIVGGTQTAIIESAACVGLPQTPPRKRDPKYTSSYGVGEMILETLREDCNEIIIGLGGTATNDGGAGMAQAIGVRLLDENGNDLPRGGAAIRQLHAIDVSKRDPRLLFTKVIAACDVDCPLLGEHGATQMFSWQKGASESDVALLEDALAHFSEIVEREMGKNVRELPGAGAAGGLGFGLAAFLNASLVSGIDLVLDRVEFERHCVDADFIFTGEGKLDEQTKRGKALCGITQRASKLKRPVIAFAGIADETNVKLRKQLWLKAIHCITPEKQTEEESLTFAAKNLEAKVREVVMRLTEGAR